MGCRLCRRTDSDTPAAVRRTAEASRGWVLCLVVQLCLTLCDPMDCSPPGSSVHGISQTRILEWVAISFSRGSSRLSYRHLVSCVSCMGRWILYCATSQKNSMIPYM